MAYQRTTIAHRLLDVGKGLMLLGVLFIMVVNSSEAGGPRVNHISWWLAVGLAAGIVGLAGVQRRMAARRRERFLSDAINTAVRTRQLTYPRSEDLVLVHSESFIGPD